MNADGHENPALFGADGQPRMVAVELHELRKGGDRMILFTRDGDTVTRAEEPFHPFIVAEAGAVQGCPAAFDQAELKGRGPLNSWFAFPPCAGRSPLESSLGTNPACPIRARASASR